MRRAGRRLAVRIAMEYHLSFSRSASAPLPRPSLHRKASHEIFSRLWLPTNFVRLPPLKGGARVSLENSCCPLRGHRVYGVKRRE